MNKSVLIEIIENLAAFEADYQAAKPYKLVDFLGYLNARQHPEIEMRKIDGNREAHIQDVRMENNSDVSILITLMFRYAKGYMKKALEDSLLQTADDFGFLITLMTHDSLTKTELINTQVVEKTSGVEVIKRLLSQELIMEFDDTTDKRSKRVSITQNGKKEIEKVLPHISIASKIVVGNLSGTEMNTLLYLLKKLDHYHNDIFMNKRNLSLEEILKASL